MVRYKEKEHSHDEVEMRMRRITPTAIVVWEKILERAKLVAAIKIEGFPA